MYVIYWRQPNCCNNMVTKVKTDTNILISRFYKNASGNKSQKMTTAWKDYRFGQLCSALKQGYVCFFEYIKENGELRKACGFVEQGTFEICVSKEGNQYIRYMEVFPDGHMEMRTFRVDRFIKFTHYAIKGEDI